MLAAICLAAGASVDLSVQDGRIAITSAKTRPREGWAAAFGEVRKLGDEDLAWLGSGNEGGDELQW